MLIDAHEELKDRRRGEIADVEFGDDIKEEAMRDVNQVLAAEEQIVHVEHNFMEILEAHEGIIGHLGMQEASDNDAVNKMFDIFCDSIYALREMIEMHELYDLSIIKEEKRFLEHFVKSSMHRFETDFKKFVKDQQKLTRDIRAALAKIRRAHDKYVKVAGNHPWESDYTEIVKFAVQYEKYFHTAQINGELLYKKLKADLSID